MLSPADHGEGCSALGSSVAVYIWGQDALAAHQADYCPSAQLVDSEDSCTATEQSTALCYAGAGVAMLAAGTLSAAPLCADCRPRGWVHCHEDA